MDVIDKYLAAHAAYVEALEALDAVGTLARDVGEQLLAAPQNVRIDGNVVSLARPVNRRDDDVPATSPWPTPDQIRAAVERFVAAKEALVAEGEALVAAKAPVGLRGPTDRGG